MIKSFVIGALVAVMSFGSVQAASATPRWKSNNQNLVMVWSGGFWEDHKNQWLNDDKRALVIRGAAAWNKLKVPGGKPRFALSAETHRSFFPWNPCQGRGRIYNQYRSLSELRMPAGAGVTYRCTIWPGVPYRNEAKRIIAASVTINSDLPWYSGTGNTPSNQADFFSTATHEYGHTLGLWDLYNEAQCFPHEKRNTMCQGVNDTVQRTPTKGYKFSDANNLKWIYSGANDMSEYSHQ